MHQSFDYDPGQNAARITNKEVTLGGWLKAKATEVKENVVKARQRRGVLNAMADALLEEAKVVEKPMPAKVTKLEQVVSQATS